MISLQEAQTRLFALRSPVETQNVPLNEAAGGWAAEDVIAKRTQPAHDLSAMDGYAICMDDAPGPWRIISESAAGRRFSGRVAAGEAVRIFTGAIVPEGADSVLIQENAVQTGTVLELTGDAPFKSQHIRAAAADFAKDAVLVASGSKFTAARIALAAMGGHAMLPVRRKLRVAILSTGDELRPPGEICADDQIPSSNAAMLIAMLSALPVEIDDRGIVRDDLVSLKTELNACNNADIIVTIGGASVGDHDLVRPALIAAGAVLDFWKIAMRPGKPVMAGTLGNAVVLGLPGNPVSAFVTALLLLKPLIAHLSGANAPLPPRIAVKLGEPLPPNGNRMNLIRGSLRDDHAYTSGRDDSSMLAALSASNLLIIRDVDAPAAQAGDIVYGMLLD